MLNPNYFLPYIILAIAVTVLTARMQHPGLQRWLAVVLILTGFCLFGHVDDFLGAREHRELCAKEAGVKVYKKAHLPPEFYDADGTPNFMRPEGPDHKRLEGYIHFRPNNSSNFSSTFLRIDKWVDQVVDSATGEVLAEHIDFAAWPSPFIPSFGHQSAKACPPKSPRKKDEIWRDMYRRVFYREHEPSSE
ncbi:MAG: hypothetical protein U1E63_05950 [Burkholderiales bacterium]